MTTPRSIEEIVEEFHFKLDQFRLRLTKLNEQYTVSDAENIERGYKEIENWVRTTLTAERERSEGLLGKVE
jgi:hypothetical protein